MYIMTNLELNAHEQENGTDYGSGLESIAALAGKMGRLEDSDTSKKELPKPIEEIDATCIKLFGRNRDRLAREFQVVGLIDGYKRWGVKGENRAIHREILKAVLDDQVAERKPDEFNPDGTIHRMTIVLKDGRVLSEERYYDTREPTFDQKRVELYVKDGVISEQEASNISLVYRVLMGEELPDGIDAEQLRDSVGLAKEKILRYYNRRYQQELFFDGGDGDDRDGLSHDILEDGTPVVILKGAAFKILVHIRNAMRSAQCEKSAEDLITEDPKHEWEAPHPGTDYIPHGLSTSLISSDKINILRHGELIFGFAEIRDDSIVTMSEEDVGSSINARSRHDIIGGHGNERLMMPDELIEKTGAEDAMASYNEVVLDRLAGGKLIMPSCLIVFGKSLDDITDLQKQYAKSFGVPIYLIDGDKYGGVHALGDE